MARKLVTKDGNTVYCATCLEMTLNLLRCGAVVNLWEYGLDAQLYMLKGIVLTFPTKTLRPSAALLSSSVSIGSPSPPSALLLSVAAACSSRNLFASRSISSTRCFISIISCKIACPPFSLGRCSILNMYFRLFLLGVIHGDFSAVIRRGCCCCFCISHIVFESVESK